MLSAFCVLRSVYFDKPGFRFENDQGVEFGVQLDTIEAGLNP